MAARFTKGFQPNCVCTLLCLCAWAVLLTLLAAQQAPSAPQQRWWERPDKGVYKARIEPHWLGDSPRFWYRNDLRGGAREFVLVDAEKNTQAPAFDHAKLAAALSSAAGQKYSAD